MSIHPSLHTLLPRLFLFSFFSSCILKTTSVNAQFSMNIIGAENNQELRQFVKQCFDILDLKESLHINLFLSRNLPAEYQGRTVKKENDCHGIAQFEIYLDDGLSGRRQRLVLAHELIHVKQYLTKRLAITPEKVLWLGKKYHVNFDDLQRSPWESEAYLEDSQLVKKVVMREKKEKNSTLAVVRRNEAALPSQQ